MKSRLLVLMPFVIALLAGCEAPSGDYCQIAKPIYYGSLTTVDWLIENDTRLITDITVHNEQVERLCL